MTHLPFLLIPVFLLIGMIPGAKGADPALRSELDRVYHDWRSALINKNMDAWKRSTSLFRQVVTRNLIVSGGQPYPDSIFEIPIQPPEITKLRMLECEANGNTAHLVYFGKIDLGLDAEKIPDNLLILKFFREGQSWKFDTTRFINLEEVPDIRAGLQNGSADFLNEPAFTPSGIVPPVPAECRKPPYMAALQMQSYGYETKAQINGFDYPPVTDNSEQQLIIGGLAWGKNDLKLSIKAIPIPEGEERILEVNAVVITHAKDRPQIRIFSWETTSATPPAEIDLPVWVSGGTLKGH